MSMVQLEPRELAWAALLLSCEESTGASLASFRWDASAVNERAPPTQQHFFSLCEGA